MFPQLCKHVAQVVAGSAGNSPSCKWHRWHAFYFDRKARLLIDLLYSQSFSKLEAGTPPAAPGCGGTATAGSPRGCRGTARVGTGWCGRWLGPCTPGQTRWYLGDISSRPGRLGSPDGVNLSQQVIWPAVWCEILKRVLAEGLTQVTMEKKEKATMARAASLEPWNSTVVLDHWLARTQKQMNHRNVHTPVPQSKQS